MNATTVRVALALALVAAPLAAAETSPNIVLILTDDQGWSQNSESMDSRHPDARSTYLETPNINRFMNQGMRFTSGYSPAPLCTPTRRSIQCGTTTARSGTEFASPWVPADHLTIPRALKQANPNYRCAHFGKWGEQMISTPEQCGYDASDGMTGNGTGGMPGSLGARSRNHDDGPPHYIDNEDPKRTETVTRNSIAFIKQQAEAGRPFYVQASYYAVHLSVVCRETTLAKYERKGTPDRGYTTGWAAMLDDLDHAIEELLGAIDEAGVADNTYVILTADNGGRGTVPHGDQARLPTNHPLTGAKHSLYEGGIRVPFAVRGPGVEAGSFCHVPVAGYDFLPTFVDLAGGSKTVLTDEVDGTSFVPLLRSPENASGPHEGRALYFHRPRRGMSAIRQGDEKLLLHWNPNGTVRQRELFRLDATPVEEGHDLFAKEPELAAALERRLLKHLESVDAEKLPAGRAR